MRSEASVMIRKCASAGVSVLGILLGSLLAGGVRADGFGFSGTVLIGELFYAGWVILVFSATGWLIGARRRGNSLLSRKWLLWMASGTLLCVLAAETWCGIEEWRFKGECEARGLQNHDRARWFPYRHWGLVRDGDEFYGHD